MVVPTNAREGEGPLEYELEDRSAIICPCCEHFQAQPSPPPLSILSTVLRIIISNTHVSPTSFRIYREYLTPEISVGIFVARSQPPVNHVDYQ